MSEIHIYAPASIWVGPQPVPDGWIERGTVLAECCNRRRNPDHCDLYVLECSSPWYGPLPSIRCKTGAGCRLIHRTDGGCVELSGRPQGLVVASFDDLPKRVPPDFHWPAVWQEQALKRMHGSQS